MASRAPDWPKMMKRSTVALYLDMSPTEVDREVAAGRLPHPVKLGNHDHWNRTLLDERAAELTGEGKSYDWRKNQPAYARS